MATRTWTAAVNTDYANVGNWAEGAAAVDGDTVDCSTSTMPASNQLAAGTLHFSLTNDDIIVTLADFVNGASVGSVTINATGGLWGAYGPVAGITGNLTIVAGYFGSYGPIGGACDVQAAGQLWVNENTAITEALTSTGTIHFGGNCALTAPSFATCAGAIDGTGTCSLDIAAVITVTGALTITGPIDIMGGFNANGQTVTWTGLAAGDTLLCDQDGTLDLGNAAGASTAVLAVAVNNGAEASTGAAMTMGSFTLTSGTFSGVHDLSINGNLTYTSGTVTHTGVWTLATSASVSWNAISGPIPALVVGNGVTMTLGNNVYAKKLTVPASGVVAMGANVLVIRASADNFASLLGTWTGTGGVQVRYFSVPRSNNGAISIGSIPFRVWPENAATLTQTANLTCGAIQLNTNASGAATLTMGAGAKLTCGAVTLGYPSGTISGILDLSSGGVHQIASLVRGHADNTANALTLGSASLFVTGTLNGYAGETYKITVTTSGGRIDAQGTGRVTAVDCSATGRLVVYRGKDDTKRIVGWNQDGCVNVRHYPARIVGDAQGLVVP